MKKYFGQFWEKILKYMKKFCVWIGVKLNFINFVLRFGCKEEVSWRKIGSLRDSYYFCLASLCIQNSTYDIKTLLLYLFCPVRKVHYTMLKEEALHSTPQDSHQWDHYKEHTQHQSPVSEEKETVCYTWAICFYCITIVLHFFYSVMPVFMYNEPMWSLPPG